MDKQLKKEIIDQFGKTSNIKGGIAIIMNCSIFLGLMLIASYMFTESLCAYIVISFLVGCSLRGFDNLTHEASHFNLFRGKKTYKYLEFLICFPVFKTLKEYRKSHMDHHRYYRNQLDKDPDSLQVKRWKIESKKHKSFLMKILYFFVFRQIIGYYVYFNLRYNFLPHFRSKDSAISRVLFWSCILIVTWITDSWNFLILGYLIPYFYWLPFIRFIVESSKHTNVNLEDEFSNSRNNIGTLHQLILHPHNDGFHQMHHLIPSIPGYNLKKAYRYLKKYGKVDKRVIESKSLLETAKQVFY